MIGPTGVGKQKFLEDFQLAQAPFIKVEATRFTEVGYVGRDVEQIIRDLIEIAIAMEKEKGEKKFMQRLSRQRKKKFRCTCGQKSKFSYEESFRKRLRSGDLDKNEIEIEVNETKSGMPSFEIPGMPGANIGMVNLGKCLVNLWAKRERRRK